MPNSSKQALMADMWPHASRWILLVLLVVLPGCGSATSGPQPDAAVQDDPEGEFNWGMERLDRALRLFKPGGADGLAVTNRKLEYELFPPDGETPYYTARVSVTSVTAFLHGKRKVDEKPPAKQKEKKPKINDPLDNQSDVAELIDLPNVGPQAPDVVAEIETRTVDTETVFELEYQKGRWKLSKEPELEHEKLWFEYAFD